MLQTPLRRSQPALSVQTSLNTPPPRSLPLLSTPRTPAAHYASLLLQQKSDLQQSMSSPGPWTHDKGYSVDDLEELSEERLDHSGEEGNDSQIDEMDEGSQASSDNYEPEIAEGLAAIEGEAPSDLESEGESQILDDQIQVGLLSAVHSTNIDGSQAPTRGSSRGRSRGRVRGHGRGRGRGASNVVILNESDSDSEMMTVHSPLHMANTRSRRQGTRATTQQTAAPPRIPLDTQAQPVLLHPTSQLPPRHSQGKWAGYTIDAEGFAWAEEEVLKSTSCKSPDSEYFYGQHTQSLSRKCRECG
jgi:hypothetical protein